MTTLREGGGGGGKNQKLAERQNVVHRMETKGTGEGLAIGRWEAEKGTAMIISREMKGERVFPCGLQIGTENGNSTIRSGHNGHRKNARILCLQRSRIKSKSIIVGARGI